MSKESFLNTVVQPIRTENLKRGNPLFNSVVIAQAILETGWGNSSLMMKANALFGIKATSSWTGKVYSSKTKEVYSGVTVTEDATFRAYSSIEESISDYFDLICNNSRYSKALNQTDYGSCIQEIKNGGYATDPKYVSTIVTLIKQNNLDKYDVSSNDTTSKLAGYTDSELADKVINGEFGDGDERKQALGDRYNTVQAIVNARLSAKSLKTTKIRTYTVKKGDCLSKIAKKYGVTVTTIAEYNGITNVDYIQVGQKLKIPVEV